VLAGDIDTAAHGIDWASCHFSIPTVLIAGNHEPYEHADNCGAGNARVIQRG
jgi:hypothetical protein